jgi:metal-sulfur cluster biosynthetic enzyme
VSAPAAVRDARDEQIIAALHEVYDPCSLALNNPLSIVDMGLVNGWQLDADGALQVTMCVTGPGCLMAPKFTAGAREQLLKLPFVRTVDVEVDASVLWSPDLMTDRGRQQQRAAHQRARRLVPVRPQQWREADVDSVDSVAAVRRR